MIRKIYRTLRNVFQCNNYFQLKHGENLLIVVMITAFFAIHPTVIDDDSLITRFSHWSHFFQSLEIVDLLFPFMNEYRISLNGSLHNEFLEIFSFFGLISILFFIQLYKMTTNNVIDNYSMVIKLLLFVMIVGMIVQLNILNPYLSILFALFLSLVHQNEKESQKIVKNNREKVK